MDILKLEYKGDMNIPPKQDITLALRVSESYCFKL